MADVVSIDVARMRSAARRLRSSAESLDGAAPTEFGFAGDGPEGPARERAIREGYLRLARAIGAWGIASATTDRTLLRVVDDYEQQDAATADDIAAAGEH